MQINERYLLFQQQQILGFAHRLNDSSSDRFQHTAAVYNNSQPIFIEHLSGLEENDTPEDNS